MNVKRLIKIYLGELNGNLAHLLSNHIPRWDTNDESSVLYEHSITDGLDGHCQFRIARVMDTCGNHLTALATKEGRVKVYDYMGNVVPWYQVEWLMDSWDRSVDEVGGAYVMDDGSYFDGKKVIKGFKSPLKGVRYVSEVEALSNNYLSGLSFAEVMKPLLDSKDYFGRVFIKG